MYWKDRVRDLTPEEENLIRDFVLIVAVQAKKKLRNIYFKKFSKARK